MVFVPHFAFLDEIFSTVQNLGEGAFGHYATTPLHYAVFQKTVKIVFLITLLNFHQL